MKAKQVKLMKAYVAKIHEAEALLKKIQEGIDNHSDENTELHWGYYGDMEHLVEELQDLSDWLNHEGEFAS